jgi:hypothetical protein
LALYASGEGKAMALSRQLHGEAQTLSEVLLLAGDGRLGDGPGTSSINMGDVESEGGRTELSGPAYPEAAPDPAGGGILSPGFSSSSELRHIV